MIHEIIKVKSIMNNRWDDLALEFLIFQPGGLFRFEN